MKCPKCGTELKIGTQLYLRQTRYYYHCYNGCGWFRHPEDGQLGLPSLRSLEWHFKKHFMKLTLAQAVEKALKPEVYLAVKTHLSPPEILKIAALQCFLHEQEEGVEDVIRAAMIVLDATGLMSDKI